MKIKVITQIYTSPEGVRKQFGVIINNVPKYTFETREEVEYFLKGIGVKENGK